MLTAILITDQHTFKPDEKQLIKIAKHNYLISNLDRSDCPCPKASVSPLHWYL